MIFVRFLVRVRGNAFAILIFQRFSRCASFVVVSYFEFLNACCIYSKVEVCPSASGDISS